MSQFFTVKLCIKRTDGMEEWYERVFEFAEITGVAKATASQVNKVFWASIFTGDEWLKNLETVELIRVVGVEEVIK